MHQNEDFSKENFPTNLTEYFRKYAQKILSFVNVTKKFELPKRVKFSKCAQIFEKLQIFKVCQQILPKN
jgi:hypothetical protein